MVPCLRTFLAASILFVSSFASAAELPSPIERPVIPRLPLLARKSGYIFSGTVKSIKCIAPTSKNSVPVMRLTFQVDKGYLGVHSGQELVIHEYAGLWQTRESYRTGEKVLLFLYPPSKLGLTSPVGGMSGRFAVDPGGRIIVDPRPTAGDPTRRPRPVRTVPTRGRLKPDQFARALRSAFEDRP